MIRSPLRFFFALAIALTILETRAAAQCRSPDTPAIASEARRARWLIGDDARYNAVLDDERHRFHLAMQSLKAPESSFHAFASAAFFYQAVWPLDVCTTVGDREALFERMRGSVIAGVTHTATRLHARVSFVGALDQVHVSIPGESSTDARLGEGQYLFAARVGHERWLKLLFGYVGAPPPFSQQGTGGVNFVGPQKTTAAPGGFTGLVIPALHTSAVVMLQDGRMEVFSVLASDLRPGRLPFAVSLGPTYIREERQTVGLLRLRSISHEQLEAPAYDSHVDEGEVHEGASTGHVVIGPVAEISAESRDARLRHGRFRLELEAFDAFASEKLRHTLHAKLYVEGTLFRSRFFSESVVGPMEEARGTAWGLGGGGILGAGWAPVFIGLEFHGAVNRPELLALLPSAADLPELRAGLMFRVER